MSGRHDHFIHKMSLHYKVTSSFQSLVREIWIHACWLAQMLVDRVVAVLRLLLAEASSAFVTAATRPLDRPVPVWTKMNALKEAFASEGGAGTQTEDFNASVHQVKN
jgi:hypothetical protein